MREAIGRFIQPPQLTEQAQAYWDKIEDMIAVLRTEMPEMLKVFGL